MSSTQERMAVAEAPRALRVDAQRNRDKLLAAAAEVFAASGVEGSLEDVARRAGVGVGTLYRHFPTRDALVEAVYRREVDLLCDAASALLSELPADEALAEWMRRFVGHVATKRGMATALKSMVAADAQLFDHCRANMHAAAQSLLDEGARGGLIRSDVSAADLMRAMSGICLVSDQDGWQDQAKRLVALLLDGLRHGAAGSPQSARG